MSKLCHQLDNAITDMTARINSGDVSQRVSEWLESGSGYPESFTVSEMEAVYAYARIGRLCWFIEAQRACEAGSPLFNDDAANGGREG